MTKIFKWSEVPCTNFKAGDDVRFHDAEGQPVRATVDEVTSDRVYVRVPGRKARCWFDSDEVYRLRVVS